LGKSISRNQQKYAKIEHFAVLSAVFRAILHIVTNCKHFGKFLFTLVTISFKSV